MALKAINDWAPTLYSYIWKYRTTMKDWKVKDKWKQILIHTFADKQDLGKALKRQTNGWVIKLGARISTHMNIILMKVLTMNIWKCSQV
jgi:hypothetical protein